jgi:hypothetical protein
LCGPAAAPLLARGMPARTALGVLAWSGDGSPVWGCTTTSGVQVPPRTPKPGKSPAQQASLEHATRPPVGCWAVPAPPGGEAARTAPLIAPLIPPRARPGGREHGKPVTARRLPVAAAPEVPAVPDDVVYGFGRMDESGRVADRAMTATLGWQRGTG